MENKPMELEVGVFGKDNAFRTVVTHARLAVGPRASLAMSIMQVLAVATSESMATTSNGLTSDGPLLPPAEVVDRAIDIADIAFDRFAERGWIVPTPPLAELIVDGPKFMGPKDGNR